MSPRCARALAMAALLLAPAAGRAVPRLLAGSYVGDGAATRAITGLGFSPRVLILRGELLELPIVATATMPAGRVKFLAASGGQIPNYVQSLDADGFTITSDIRVNQAGTTYHYAAFAEVPGEMKAGGYEGDNSDNRSITGLGFPPELVFVLNEANANPVLRGSGMVGDLSYEFTANAGLANAIQALESDGFQVGNDGSVNKLNTYDYVAWRSVKGGAQVGTYVGDGTAGRTIDCGWAPEWVFVKGDAGAFAVFKTITTGATTDLTFPATAAGGFAGGITSLTSTGFSLGMHASVNAAGANYVWMAFGSAPVAPADAGLPEDAGTPDVGQPDVGQPDAGQQDVGQPDVGEADVGRPDAGEPDTGSAADAETGGEDAAVALDAEVSSPDGGRVDGSRQPIGFDIGCGCGQGESAAGLLWLLALGPLLRRRWRG